MKVLFKNRKGFSLVELIVVIAIMAVLAGVVGGTLFSQKNKSEDNIAETEALNVLQNCRNIYILWLNGHSSADEFTIEYLRSELNDLFQDENEFVFDEAGPANTHKYLVELRNDTTTGKFRYIDVSFTSKRTGNATITKSFDITSSITV